MNIVLELERYRHALGGMLLVLLATTVNATELDKVDNWDVDGQMALYMFTEL
nr:hypothetical protein [Providencia sp. G1(2023)]